MVTCLFVYTVYWDSRNYIIDVCVTAYNSYDQIDVSRLRYTYDCMYVYNIMYICISQYTYSYNYIYISIEYVIQ